ncbi:MAG: type I polyketide synthase [Caldilineaceae bacterium]
MSQEKYYANLMQEASKKLATLQATLDEHKRRQNEPIAIIGLGCRFPGGANQPEAFWELLKNGGDAVCEVPASRWDIDAYYDPEPGAPGKMYTRQGAFLDEVTEFDPLFFGISPREALAIDPQQRLLLEVCWEALENANLVPDTLFGSQTGVFVGMYSNEYGQLLAQSNPEIAAHFGTGNANSVAAGRISYTFGLTGPCLVVDTACSSSLLAVHLACQSLRNRECDLALAGGVNLLLTPEFTVNVCQARMLAPDGHCKTFDAAADGYVRGEGCGMIVLKRLSDATAAGDQILALIRSSAVNQDGRSSGLTAPNGLSQQALIRQALTRGALAPSDIHYIEAHGTGTALGDPIEIGALQAIFGVNAKEPPWISSVKTNIGHLEAAAGIAGLIKVVLSLQHDLIPPHLHFKQLNPKIPWQELPALIPTAPVPWPRGEQKRRAGISAFGFSGTNVHMILEEAPTPEDEVEPAAVRPWHILTLSAKTEPALQALAAHYVAYLQSQPEAALANICFTANTRRARFSHQVSVVANSSADLTEKLAAFQAGQRPMGVSQSIHAPHQAAPKIAFLFTGQGAQYVNMGRALYASQPTFRQVIDRCDALLHKELGRSLLGILYPEMGDGGPVGSPEAGDGRRETGAQWAPRRRETEGIDGNLLLSASSLLDETAYTQPALFALEYALAELWRSWGITPSFVCGHSVGEYVAACVAGVFTLEEGLRLIAERGRLMQALPPNGAMVAVAADEAFCQEVIAPYGQALALAAINGPTNVVLSGERTAMQAVVATLQQQGVKTTQLTVSHAFHSALMEPMLADFRTVAQSIRFKPPQLPLIANVTGQVAGAEITTADYWTQQIRQPVRFADCMSTLHAQGCAVFVEVGPKAVLLGMGRQHLPADYGHWLPSLRPGPEWEQLLTTLGALYGLGAAVDWLGFDRDYPRRRVALPTYPFQRERYWVSAEHHTPAAQPVPLSPIVSLLNQGAVQQLAEQLALGDGFSAAERELMPKLLDRLVKQHQASSTTQSDTVFNYYNALAQESLEDANEPSEPFEQTFLTFGPFAEVVPGFSWLRTQTKAHRYRSFTALSKLAQEEMRQMLFAEVDFAACRKVLDFGCGYGSDLIALAARYDHLELCGYTISSEQAQVAVQKVAMGGLQARVQVFNRDSARDPFPDQYDLVFGFEVAHHIKDKAALFANLANHTTANGYLVLADFISNASFAIEHEATSSYFITKEEWVALLSQHHFVLSHGIDISQEVANYLYDPDFDKTLAELMQPQQNQDISAALHSYDRLGQLFRQGLASYVLLTGRKSELPAAELMDLNRKVLDTLTSYAESAESQWLYEVAWEASPNQPDLQAPGEGPGEGPWLLFADKGGVATALAERLQTAGEHCILVYPGDSYQPIAGAERVCPSQQEDLQRLLLETLPAGTAGNRGRAYRGIVYLWSLDVAHEATETLCTSVASGQTQTLLCDGLLHLVQSCAAMNLSTHLWVVTQGALTTGQELAAATGQAPLFVQGMLWGLGGVIAQEHPELHCVRLDLDPSQAENPVSALLAELQAPDQENQLAYRQGVRYVARLAPRRNPALQAAFDAVSGGPPTDQDRQSMPIRADGSYLITGGLGGLGLQVAEWLAAEGAGEIILAGRRGAAGKEEVVRALAATGVQLQVIQGDVADAADVARMVTAATLPLRGVIHAAGVLDDGLLRSQTSARFAQVLAPKVQGAWHLHSQTQTLALDFFVCFSSVAALLGAPGQGNYAAGNAFLDGLAHYRRAQGLPALSINWGPWAEVGMAAQRDFTGMGMIPPKRGIRLLAGLLGAGGQVGVLRANWAKLLALFPTGGVPPFLANLARQAETTLPDAGCLRDRLEDLPATQRLSFVIEEIQKRSAQVLGLRATQLNAHDSLNQVGLDSLMAIELRNQFKKDFDVDIPVEKLIEGSTIAQLAELVLEQIIWGALLEQEPLATEFDEEMEEFTL